MTYGKIYAEGHAALFPFHLFMDPWAEPLADKIGWPLKKSVGVFENSGVTWFTDEKEQTMTAKALLDKMLTNGYFEVVRDETDRRMDVLGKATLALERTDFSGMSVPTLIFAYTSACAQVVELNAFGTLVTLMEMGHQSVITDAAYGAVRERAAHSNQLERVPEALATLLTPTQPTFMRFKERDVLNAAIVAAKKGFHHASVQKAIAQIHRKYAWLNFGYVGPALSRKHFEDEVAEAAKSNPEAALAELEGVGVRLAREQRALEKSLALDAADLRLLEMARTFMFQKEYRKQLLYRWFCAMMPLRKAIAKSLGLGMTQMGFVLPEDLNALVLGKRKASDLLLRSKFCVYLPFGRRVLTGGKAKAKAEPLLRAAPAVAVDELRGQCAHAGGTVRAVCRVVFTAHDLNRLKPGEILVSPATSPSMVPGMKIASAIVTDQGGVTCHAAILSRELKKPCVIGTKIATQAFKDGDVLEVNALAGTVRKTG
ncbi:MAG: PEP-utilizing enzyme [Candidatus Micrarchaeota archaeon]|nr:PEP-utilizing enzyme [Candidatus Micrarchaeota archaeon]